MRIIHSEAHRHHDGQSELKDGKLLPCFERPERAFAIVQAVLGAGLGPLEAPDDLDDRIVRRVHDDGFVDFLTGVWDRWVALRGDYDALPLSWPGPGMRRRRPESLDGQLGYYSYDAGTPITAGTWTAALAAARSAATAARLVADGAGPAFALTRPPGHHAGRDFYGGYCFVNTAAVAAQSLLDRGAARVAVLDVDYHHGNGTQEIFYGRGDVLFVSIHADPRDAYPYFAGFADEHGAGPGEGLNVNIPLPLGTVWSGYAEALAGAVERVRAFGPDALVVSFGADTFGGDPISRFALTSEDFLRLGEALAGIGLPTAIIMEGGYAIDRLGQNVVNLLTGFSGTGPR